MKDMVTDGVAAEVLYPSLGLGLFCLEDAALQEALRYSFSIGMFEVKSVFSCMWRRVFQVPGTRSILPR